MFTGEQRDSDDKPVGDLVCVPSLSNFRALPFGNKGQIKILWRPYMQAT